MTTLQVILMKNHAKNLLLALLVLCLVLLIIISRIETRQTELFAYTCYMKSEANAIEGLTRVEDVLQSDVKPSSGKTIFFIETKCHSRDTPYIFNLTARQACAIESAALHNPNFQVFVLFASPTYLSDNQKNPLLDAIRGYKNVKLRELNLWRYAEDTPIADWVMKGDLFKSRFLMEHTSDLLRFLTLYRFGGIYLDTDVVVLRSLENLSLNYVGAENSEALGSAVISLEPTGVGHDIGKLFLLDFEKNYNGNLYVNNGPSLISRMMRKICGTIFIKQMQENPRRCRGFQVFNSSAFFAVPWDQWTNFIDPNLLNDTMEKTKDSYLIHLWNRNSYKRLLKVGSQTAYGKYAEQHCPKTYATAIEYF